MKKLLFISVISVALFGCGQPNNVTTSDGYNFGKPSYVRDTVEVEIIRYKNREEFVEAAKNSNVENPGIVAAFTQLRSPFHKCTIHIVDPQVSYEPEWLGHELAHCLYGQWHTNNDSRG
jgi:hypothetical protein